MDFKDSSVESAESRIKRRSFLHFAWHQANVASAAESHELNEKEPRKLDGNNMAEQNSIEILVKAEVTKA